MLAFETLMEELGVWYMERMLAQDPASAGSHGFSLLYPSLPTEKL